MQHPACPMGADVCAWQCTLDLINKATPGSPRGAAACAVRTCLSARVRVCVGRCVCVTERAVLHVLLLSVV